MRKSFFTLFAVILLFGINCYVYSENVVSLKQDPDAVSPQIKVDIQLRGGQGVSGYNSLIVFDATVLKYISASMGDYLPSGGIFIRPLLREDGSYTLAFDVGNATQTGTTVTFGEEQLSLSEFFFEIPSEALEDFSSEIPEVPAAFLRPGAKLWGISILGSAPLDAEGFPIPTDGDGTLVTLTFEVINTAHPAFVVLPDVSLFDSNDVTTLEKRVIATSLQEDTTLSTDVNGDGEVNILDLVRIASVFGQPVSAENAVADVNGDNQINILDLVRVAGDFGKEIVAHETEPETTETEPETTETEPETTETEPEATESELPVPTQEPGGITISEIMYSKRDWLMIKHQQWIELYNSGTDRISLRGWTLEIENSHDPTLDEELYSQHFTISFDGRRGVAPTLFPNEVALIVANGSFGDDTTGLHEDQIYDLYGKADLIGFGFSDTMLSVGVFRIKLIDPKGNVVDEVGNFDGTKELWRFNLGSRGTTREGYRSSVMRRYEKGVALNGTQKESWIPAVDANLTEAQRTYYGVDTDIGSPGIPPETEQ